MKKLLLLTVLLSSFAFSQFKEVKRNCQEIGKNGNFAITLQTLEKCNDVYLLTYKDIKFQNRNEYKTIAFNDAESLFDVVVKNFKDMPKEDVIIEFEDGIITLAFSKQLGINNVKIHHTDLAGITGFTGWITEKQFHKLFGKKYVKQKKKRKNKK